MVLYEIFHRCTVPATRNTQRSGSSCDSTRTATTTYSSNYLTTTNNNNGNARILAFSVTSFTDTNTLTLCADRRGFFDHLVPKTFFKNGFRIAVMQSTTIITNYYNDQLKYDIEREGRIVQGEITRQQADREEEEWQEKEWTLRLESIPGRIYVSFLKYHAIVLVMRMYEHIASKYLTLESLDALTIDTFECAKRTANKTENNGELFNTMLTTCWKANTISFLADYSVHQIILAYGYYVYVKEQRRKRKRGDVELEADVKIGPLALSFVHKSSMLALSRGLCFNLCSIGGAFGTLLWPGWGTLAGSNLGDSMSLSFFDDVKAPQ